MVERRATMKDVARASGVSPATVSFVLNETPGQTIPAETRDRVRAAATALGYQPHGLARALREGRSRVALLDIGQLRGGRALEGFIRGLNDELQKHGYGLLVYPGLSTDPGHAELVRNLRPLAEIDLAELYADRSDVDDGGWIDGLAAHTMTQLAHLVERGHTSIAFAVPGEDADALVGLRLRFAVEAGRKLGVKPVTAVVVPEPPDDARRAVAQLRVENPAITAIASFDDEIALRVLGSMSDLALSPPADLAVIGFDDSRVGAIHRPPLTTVRVDGGSFGRRAARRILALPEEEPTVASAVVVIRDTT